MKNMIHDPKDNKKYNGKRSRKARIVCLWMERVFQVHRGERRENKDSIQTYCRFKIQNLKPLELTGDLEARRKHFK